MERITSSHNPLVQHMRKLQTSRAYRESCGEFVADGWKLLEEALKWYSEVTAVLTSEPERCPALPASARLVEVPASLMQSVSSMRTPQGVLFSLRLPQEGALRVQPGMLLLDRIQDPGNLGTILRTADAFDLPVLLTNGCADPFSEKTVRASMGAVFRRPPQSAPMEDVLRVCHAAGIPIAATALSDTACDLREVDLKRHLVVIGSEGQGICRSCSPPRTGRSSFPCSRAASRSMRPSRRRSCCGRCGRSAGEHGRRARRCRSTGFGWQREAASGSGAARSCCAGSARQSAFMPWTGLRCRRRKACGGAGSSRCLTNPLTARSAFWRSATVLISAF